jgi:O-succinylbenzoate synthase
MNVRLWRQDAHLATPISAAHQRHDVRTRIFLEVDFDGVVGYGEVAPQSTALNGDPGIEEVLEEVQNLVLPQLRQIVNREGALPSWSRVARFAGPRSASNPAVGLVEMALLDRELRAMGSSIEDLWTPVFDTPRQATASLVADDEWVIGEDVVRLRVKTGPGTPSDVALERLSQVRVPVLLDFNCSATSDVEVIEQVRMVSSVARLDAVEQPYAPGNVVDHARLAEQLDVAMSIDEGIRTPRDIDQIVRYRAATIVCVKPARVGGLANARTMIARAREAGLRPYLGGFFESPYARHVHRALARSAVDQPSDLTPVALMLSGYDNEVQYRNGGFGVVPDPVMLDNSRRVTLRD